MTNSTVREENHNSTQEHHTGCKQEYGTQLVCRDIAQVVNRSMVPGWYTGVLHK